jgi:hypothetical protein
MKLPRFTFADGERAYEDWGANCGPGALALVAGLTLDELRPHLGDFESKRYTNPRLMFDCLKRLGLRWSMRKPIDWPEFGLVRVQWEGPWTEPGVPIVARYRHTHWVAGARRNGDIGVFDINCINNGSGWVSLADWSATVAPYLIKHHAQKANGKWHLTHALELLA